MAEYSLAYVAFHAWLSKNRGLIAAGPDRTVIYSGRAADRIPMWKQLPMLEKKVHLLFGVQPRWVPIEAVLRSPKLQMNLGAFAKGDPRIEQGLPEILNRRVSAWLFACNAAKEGWVTPTENKQIWKNFSACYARNAKGKVWMFVGDVLKEFPDLLLAEIPTLLKNKDLDEGTIKQAQQLAPRSAQVWAKYRRTKNADARLDGR